MAYCEDNILFFSQFYQNKLEVVILLLVANYSVYFSQSGGFNPFLGGYVVFMVHLTNFPPSLLYFTPSWQLQFNVLFIHRG